MNTEYAFSFTVDPSLLKGLQTLAREEDVAVFDLLRTSFDILLFRHSNQEDGRLTHSLSFREALQISRSRPADPAFHITEGQVNAPLPPEGVPGATVAELSQRYGRLLAAMIAGPGEPIGALPMLTPEEEHRLLWEFNDTRRPVPKDKTVVALFGEKVAALPDNIAVVAGNHRLTYRELDKRSNQLAHYLQSQGVKKETLVPICIHRSTDMIVAIVGILKAGAAYVPIDPAYPADRIAYILSDTHAQLVLTDEACATLIGAVTALCLDRDWPNISQSPAGPVSNGPEVDNLAYIIYTSGSTGRPKGVMLEHKSLLNYLLNGKTRYINDDANSSGNYAHLAYTFDGSVTGLLMPLVQGKSIVIATSPTEIFSTEEFLQQAPYDFIKLTPAHMPLLQAATEGRVEPITKRLILGGEALQWSHLKFLVESRQAVEIVNEYGPTEATVGCSVFLIHTEKAMDDMEKGLPISIGKPLDNVSLYIINEVNGLVPPGTMGELCIGGDQLARGYLNLHDLTAAKFVPDPFSKTPGARMYRTGDLATWLPDGNIAYYGRKDDQVKIRGYRIELGEVETVLQQAPGIAQSTVVVKTDAGGEKRLVAYVVPETRFDREATLSYLNSRLPDFMIPRQLIPIEKMPLTINGKVDKKALPDVDASELLTTSFVAAATNTEKVLTEVWKELLHVKKVGTSDNFFELGGSSILAATLVTTLQKQGYHLPITKLYQYPTVAGLAAFLDGKPAVKTTPAAAKQRRPTQDHEDIAIIGMAGRFPGTNTIDQLWTMLKEGRETVSFFTPDQLDPSLPARLRNDPDYVGARGVIDQPTAFDAGFFGINPKVAELMDPQQRVFLELAWETLEKTGHLPERFPGSIGVYAGTGYNTYYLNNVQHHPDRIDRVGPFQVAALNEKDYIASRTAYELDLKGPAVSIHSACSTSALAIAQAVESLRNANCDLALAGGASITFPVNSGHLYQDGAIQSPDGHSRSFDADARGTVFSDGAGVVLLKRKSDALRDGDTIYALVRGVGVNNDGRNKGSFTAPSAEGQAGAIIRAIEDAGIDPATISYVEAHGTATPVGDPIEIEGLNMAFGAHDKKQFCAIGTIKSNIGHLTAASGVAGLIKTVLALHHRQIPASINYTKPNPSIDFGQSPFFVNTSLRDWQTEGPRRAGVSSFGVGGTNVHLILEEYENGLRTSDAARPLQLFAWSAKTSTARDAYAASLAGYLQTPGTNIEDIAFSLRQRRDYTSRRFIVAANHEELLQKLTASVAATKEPDSAPESITFLFPGQGSQYAGMGAGIYEAEPVFRQAIDECAGILQQLGYEDIRTLMFPSGPQADQDINNTRYAQPALFTIEYALSRLWISWGVRPSAFVGHSIGEFVAAHLSGVFNLKDALTLVAGRSRLMADLPAGSMLGIRCDHQAISSILPVGLDMAAVNSPALCTVSGPTESINDFARLLDEKGIHNRPLYTSHAFHSAMMDAIITPFETIVRSVRLNRPRIPIVSTLTGAWLTDAEATDPGYWARHLRATVRFSDAVATLLQEPNRLLLETGPRNVAATLARQQVTKNSAIILSSLEGEEHQPDYHRLLKALGTCWLNGVSIDWDGFFAGRKRQRLQLPAYAFDRTIFAVPAPIAQTAIQPIEQIAIQPIAQTYSPNSNTDLPLPAININRIDSLIQRVKKILEDASGIEMDEVTPEMNFIEIGLDSLLLTQVAISLKKEFGLPITFRKLNEEYGSLDLLARFLDVNLPPDPAPQAPTPIYQQNDQEARLMANVPVAPQDAQQASANNTVIGLISQQIQLLAQQINLLQGGANMPVTPAVQTAPVRNAAPAAPRPAQPSTSVNGSATNGKDASANGAATAGLSAEELVELKKPFGATAKIDRQAGSLSAAQQALIAQLITNYTTKTKGSKNYTQQHRSYMADPRVVSGFRPHTKEMTYSLVIERSKGCRLWDLDGNEYIDALNGFGSSMLGYQPDFITKMLHQQIETGYEIGPQHVLAGPVSKLVCEFTGFDRAGLCNTGSEAVLGAMRIARTVTGRSTIVAFAGSYHGIVDEVIVRGTKKLKSFPAASGIMPEAVQNMLILDYGTEETLRIIRERAHEFAAVLVEPVQSRRPEFFPLEFLKELRRITEQSGTALIFDEVISGFRFHPGGIQGMYGIRADLGTYGKVIGGGISIGVIAGKKQYMDALDGGFWQYGDNSVPEAGVTYFAGTFVRHPLALATTMATLNYLKEKGPALQETLNSNTLYLTTAIEAVFRKYNTPMYIASFGSMWKVKYKEEYTYSELLFTLLRYRGIHILDGFPCYMTEAHTRADLDTIIRAFEESVAELKQAGFIPDYTPGSTAQTPAAQESQHPQAPAHTNGTNPPVPNARLGKDRNGNPAWFIPDVKNPGKYLQVLQQ